MRLCWLIFISAFAGVAAADPGAPVVLELRLGQRSVETMARRLADGSFAIEQAALLQVGVTAAPSGLVDLASVDGLSYFHDEAGAALILACTRACYAEQRLQRAHAALPVQINDGAFLNLDLSASFIDGASDAGAIVETGVFGGFGLAESSWLVAANGESLRRLETRWTLASPARRVSLRIGDGYTRAGASGAPVRFGGVQIGRDFSLDPGFVTFPTPTLSGEAAAPSTVDLYVDGALRLRREVDAGAFSIVDAPLLASGGQAQVVVTDALGRQRVFSQPFYVSSALLRQGLVDYSLTAGLQRQSFAHARDAYGDAFVSGIYRRGLTPNLTSEARFDASDDLLGGGLALAMAHAPLGQIDLALAASDVKSELGVFARTGFTRQAGALSLQADIQAASAGFRRLGEQDAPARAQVAVSGAADLDDGAVAAITATMREAHDGEEVRTFALSYAPRPVRYGRFDLQVMHVAAAESITTVGVRVVATLGHDVSANAQLERDQTRWNAAIAAQRAAPAEIGFGWRASARTGERDRIDANVTHLGSSHEAALEVSHTEISSGLRGRYAAGFAWMNGALMAARPIRGSFALVDVGAPGVRVLRDRRFAALSNAHGRALVTGLRTYEVNPIGIDLDQSPFNLSFARDEIAVVPAARSGALVRFAQQSTGAGQVRVVAATGAPLPPGALLTRESDGARFPIGSNGRAYFTGVGEAARYVSSSGCSFLLDATGLRGGGEIACAA